MEDPRLLAQGAAAQLSPQIAPSSPQLGQVLQAQPQPPGPSADPATQAEDAQSWTEQLSELQKDPRAMHMLFLFGNTLAQGGDFSDAAANVMNYQAQYHTALAGLEKEESAIAREETRFQTERADKKEAAAGRREESRLDREARSEQAKATLAARQAQWKRQDEQAQRSYNLQYGKAMADLYGDVTKAVDEAIFNNPPVDANDEPLAGPALDAWRQNKINQTMREGARFLPPAPGGSASPASTIPRFEDITAEQWTRIGASPKARQQMIDLYGEDVVNLKLGVSGISEAESETPATTPQPAVTSPVETSEPEAEEPLTFEGRELEVPEKRPGPIDRLLNAMRENAAELSEKETKQKAVAYKPDYDKVVEMIQNGEEGDITETQMRGAVKYRGADKEMLKLLHAYKRRRGWNF